MNLSGRAMDSAVCVMPSSLPSGGAVSPMPAPHRATCYLQLWPSCVADYVAALIGPLGRGLW